jgi:hypothetical protein
MKDDKLRQNYFYYIFDERRQTATKLQNYFYHIFRGPMKGGWKCAFSPGWCREESVRRKMSEISIFQYSPHDS